MEAKAFCATFRIRFLQSKRIRLAFGAFQLIDVFFARALAAFVAGAIGLAAIRRLGAQFTATAALARRKIEESQLAAIALAAGIFFQTGAVPGTNFAFGALGTFRIAFALLTAFVWIVVPGIFYAFFAHVPFGIRRANT